MNMNKAAALKETADIIVIAVQAVQQAGGDDMLVRSTIKDRLFDEELVMPSERNEVLKKLNAVMRTSYTYNQIRNAKRVDRGVEPQANESGIPVVTELKGSVELPIKQHEHPIDQPLQTAKSGLEGVVITDPAPAAVQSAVQKPTQSNSSEENTMTTSNTNSTENTIIAQLAALGYKSAKKRKALLKDFIESREEGVKLDGDDVTLDSDADTVLKALADPVSLFVFIELQKEEADKASIVQAGKERDSGLASVWVGVGAAVLGGGLSMMRKGEIDIGGVIGTAVGAGAAYLVSDYFDSNVESDFGRYLVAGSIGLTLGVVGAEVGGLAKSALPANLFGAPADDSVVVTTQPVIAHVPVQVKPQPVSADSLFGVAGL